MTQKVADVFTAKVARQKDELSRRVNEGTLDAQEVSIALQLLIENRFTVSDEWLDLLKVEVNDLELRKGTLFVIIVRIEPPVEEDGDSPIRRYSLAVDLRAGENTASVKLDEIIDHTDIPGFLVLLGESIVDEVQILQNAINKVGKLEINWAVIDDMDEIGDLKKIVSFTLSLPKGKVFSGKCNLSQVSYFLQLWEEDEWLSV